jgi:hypothetical protein
MRERERKSSAVVSKSRPMPRVHILNIAYTFERKNSNCVCVCVWVEAGRKCAMLKAYAKNTHSERLGGSSFFGWLSDSFHFQFYHRTHKKSQNIMFRATMALSSELAHKRKNLTNTSTRLSGEMENFVELRTWNAFTLTSTANIKEFRLRIRTKRGCRKKYYEYPTEVNAFPWT